MTHKRKNLLLLLNDGSEAAATPPRQSTFQERKAAQLREERASEPMEPPVNTPPPEAAVATPKGVESEQIDGYPDLPSEEAQYEAEDDGLDPEDGTLEADTEAEVQEPATDWEKRFNDTRAELTRVQESRKEMDTEHADAMAGTLQLRYQLEDKMTEVQESATFFASGIQGQINQLEQAFTQGLINPDELPAARQRHQQMVQNRNLMMQHLEKAKAAKDDATAQRKQRESEITRVRLQRSIPGWSRDKYNELKQYAESRGYSADEFSDVTDHRYFELLNDSMQLHSAEGTVNNIERKRKAKPPRARGQRQPRDAQGKYQKAQRDFHDNPNQKGRFADMKAQQLARERRGR